MITCAPNFPQGKVYEGYKNRLWQQEIIDGIRVIRVWSYVAANSGFKRRILDFISFGVSSFIASLFVKTDLIVATSPQFFTAVGGYLSSVFKRKPWIMEVRDLWPESIRAVGVASGREKWLDRLEKLELLLYRKASKIVVVTDAFKANISNRGIPAEKIEVVKNGVIPQLYAPRPKDEKLLEALNLADKFVVGYVGTHGLAHKLDFILDCAPMAHPDVHFLFIGGGAEKAKLEARVEKEKLVNVTMLPPVMKAAIPSYLSLTDIALVPLRKSDTFKTVIPSKIFENAAMKKPILLGVEGESQAIIEQYGAGSCFEPENQQDFLTQLERLRADRLYYEQCQKSCEQLAHDFDRKVLAERMLDVLSATHSGS